MDSLTWRDLLIGLDTGPFNGPICLCFEQALAAADEGDFLLMAALANLGRDVARVCRDPIAENTFCIHLGLARRELGDAEAAETILGRARTGLHRSTGQTARQNEAITLLVLGVLSESRNRGSGDKALPCEDSLVPLGCYSEGLSLLRKACRAHAERGDRTAYARANDLCKWAEDRIDNLIPCVYVDGCVENRAACLGDSALGANGTHLVSTAPGEDAIRHRQSAGVPPAR